MASTSTDRKSPSSADVKSAGAWVASALCAGVVLGVAARVAMRLVALEADVRPAFSLGGTTEIVLLGVIVGSPTALIFWVCRQRCRMPASAGVIAALALFALLAARPTPAARSALRATPDTPIATVVAFAAAFLIYGIALEVLWRLKQASASPDSLGQPGRA